jgi:hypothetical protein
MEQEVQSIKQHLSIATEKTEIKESELKELRRTFDE